MKTTTNDPTNQELSCLTITTTDSNFMCRLIDWLNSQYCENNSTTIRHSDYNPFDELDLRLAQIEGMTIRINDLERELQDK